MNTVTYAILIFSGFFAGYSTYGILYLGFHVFGFGSISLKGWLICFISWITFLLCLTELGYIA